MADKVTSSDIEALTLARRATEPYGISWWFEGFQMTRLWKKPRGTRGGRSSSHGVWINPAKAGRLLKENNARVRFLTDTPASSCPCLP